MDSNEMNLDNSLESAVNMTQEEIERFLAEQESLGSEPSGFDDTDLAGLLSGLDSTVADDDMQEISALLNRADKNEAVADDVVALMNQQDAEGETAYDAMDLFSGEEAKKKEGFFQKLINKYKQGKKEKQAEKEQKKREKQELKEKKKRELQAQKEQKAQEEQLQDGGNLHEAAPDDNMAEALALLGIEEEINQPSQTASEDAKEGKNAKKKKEKKAKKPQKEKKSKAEAPDKNGEEQIKEKPAKKKKEKKVKEKKPKDKKVKDKKPKNKKIREKEPIEVTAEFLDEELDETPNKKKIIMVFVACIMIMLGFLVVNHHITEHSNKKLAEEAYDAEDYLECYKLLYGQKLDDNQKEMFYRSEMTLKMNIFWGHYNDYIAEQKWLEGLDELVQFVYGYSELSGYARERNCQDIVEVTYNDVLNILSEDYKVSEQEVLDIANLWRDLDYTQALAELVKAVQEKYQDILPEEQDRITQN